MALKTDKVDAPTTTTPTAPAEDTVLLESALYKNYNWRGTLYEKGKAYKFTRQTAITLLGEQDNGRNIWKLYRAPKPKAAPKNLVVDVTSVNMDQDLDPIHGVVATRINIGDESEISDVVGGGDVTL